MTMWTMSWSSSSSSSSRKKRAWKRRLCRVATVSASAATAGAATIAAANTTPSATMTTAAVVASLLLLACHTVAAAATSSTSRGGGNSKDVLRQHHFRPAQRQVPYETTAAATARRTQPPQTRRSTSLHERLESSESQQEEHILRMAARMERVLEPFHQSSSSSTVSTSAEETLSSDNHDLAVYWHLLVDASVQSADDVFRELQQQQHQQQQQQNTARVVKKTTAASSAASTRSIISSSGMFSSSRSSNSVGRSSNVRRNHDDKSNVQRGLRTSLDDSRKTRKIQQQQQPKSTISSSSSSSSFSLLPRFLQSLLFADETAAENDNESSDNVFFVNSVVEPTAASSSTDLVSSSTTPGFITTNTTTELDNSTTAAAPLPHQTTTNTNTTIPDSLLDFNVSTQTDYNVTDPPGNKIPSSSNNSSIDDDDESRAGDRSNNNSSSISQNDTSTVVYTKSEAQTTVASSSESDHYDGQNTNDTDPRLGFQPIRIRAILSDIDGGGGYLDNSAIQTNEHGETVIMSQQQVLLQQIIGPALLSWSAALRVNPVAGNLTVDAHQLLDGTSCGPGVHSGLPSAPVPVSHLTTGVADTDLLLYIHLGFVINETTTQDHVNNNSTDINSSNSTSSNGTYTDSNRSIGDNENNNGNGNATSSSSSSYNWRIRNNTNTSEQSTLNRNDNNNMNGHPDSPTNNNNNSTAELLRTSNTNDAISVAGSNKNEIVSSTSDVNKNDDIRGENNSSSSWLTPSNSSGNDVKSNNTDKSHGNGENLNGNINSKNDTSSSSWLSVPPPQPPLSPKHICAGDYLAASSVCSTDQLDRPTAAILHICIGPDFFEPHNLHVNIMTVMHELGHALGFNAISMAYFRRPDGTPITPRNASGAIPETLVECTGPTIAHQQQQQNYVLGAQALSPNANTSSGNISISGGNGELNLTLQQGGKQEQPPPAGPTGLTGRLPLPSTEIVQFRTVRGGVRVAEVVTPSVQQVVRNHFDCQELPGAELESGEFLPLSTSPDEVSCLGDHWERRLFKSDLMNPVVDGLEFNPRFSTVTLAYFADSGWYQVDLSRASLAPSWGRGSGCAFVEETCIGQDGQVPPSYDSLFCNNAPRGVSQPGFAADIDGCTPDLLRKAACSIGQYEGELPAQYQYFNGTYGSNIGGSDPFMDYCPVFMGFSNGLCSDSQNEALIKVTTMERVGSRNSRCLAGRVAKKTSSSWTNPVIAKTAVCLRIACVVEDRSLRVQVDGSWHTCTREGQEIKSSTTGDIAVCPDPIRVCPTFYCPRDCLGTNHICDYQIGSCVCSGSDCEDEEVEKEKPSNTTSSPPRVAFYSPPESTAESSQPEKDSPLGDIYFPTERSLRESDEDKDRIQWEVPTGVGILVALVVLITVHHRRRKRRLSLTAAQVDNDDGDLDRNIATPPTPAAGTLPSATANKHKMIATVVVDLRMNDPRLQHYRDVLIQRGSETDASMTETEGSTNDGAASTPSPSPPPSTTEVNLTSTIMVDDPATRIPRFFQPNIRRRRFFSNLRHKR